MALRGGEVLMNKQDLKFIDPCVPKKTSNGKLSVNDNIIQFLIKTYKIFFITYNSILVYLTFKVIVNKLMITHLYNLKKYFLNKINF